MLLRLTGFQVPIGKVLTKMFHSRFPKFPQRETLETFPSQLVYSYAPNLICRIYTDMRRYLLCSSRQSFAEGKDGGV